jgi:transcriptional regulator with XRE-family HTH domain
MNGFGALLLKARQRAGFTQQELGDKVDVTDSYISKMETGVSRPPTREVALKLADVLGLSGEAKHAFLLEANAAGTEDLQGFRLVKVTDGQMSEAQQQASAPRLPTAVRAARAPASFSPRAIGEHLERLVASAGLSDEEYEAMGAVLIEITTWRLAFLETQR